MFKIIIPNYNNAKWLDKCLGSIFEQSYKDFEVIVVDDCSTDDSIEVIKKYPVSLIRANRKVYNGGARNIGIRFPSKQPYTMFIDSDDWLYNKHVLRNIARVLKKHPVDCLTLQYNAILPDQELLFSMKRNDLHSLVWDVNVACWTKVIKTELIQEFPENTLMEDAVQHIKQCNYIKSMYTTNFTSIAYNRMNSEALTSPDKRKSIKWRTSLLRLIADLMELWCENEECEARRIHDIEIAKEQVKGGEFVPW